MAARGGRVPVPGIPSQNDPRFGAVACFLPPPPCRCSGRSAPPTPVGGGGAVGPTRVARGRRPSHGGRRPIGGHAVRPGLATGSRSPSRPSGGPARPRARRRRQRRRPRPVRRARRRPGRRVRCRPGHPALPGGRPARARAVAALDEAWCAVVAELRAGPLGVLPLIVGGRSSGARVACRTAVAGAPRASWRWPFRCTRRAGPT